MTPENKKRLEVVGYLAYSLVGIAVGIAVLALIVWAITSSSSSSRKKMAGPDGIIGSLRSLVQASNGLRELVSSNQVVASRQMETLSATIASNNAAIRVETRALVDESVAKAMEPFQKLLTNPPSHCPPPVAAKASPTPPPVAAAAPAPVTAMAPSGVTNSNTLVVNNPPPQPQPVAVSTAERWVLQNNNMVVVGGGPPSVTITTNPPQPYWLRDLFK